MEENNNINIQLNQQPEEKKNERNGRGLFYFVIAFAVIIVAVVGATYAYFTASARTGTENAIKAGAAQVELGIEVDNRGVNERLIPVADNIAKYGYAMQKEVTYTEECLAYNIDGFGSVTEECIEYKKAPGSTCVDDSGSEICSAYTYTIVSTSSSDQKLTMFLGSTDNNFQNLWFAVYTDTGVDEDGKPIRTRISEPAPVPITGGEQEIIPIVVAGDEEKTTEFSDLAYPTLTADEPRKTFTIILWIKEMSTADSDPSNDDQTLTDGMMEVDGVQVPRTFSGYVRVTTGEGGVTGQIGNAANWDDTITVTSPTSPTSPTEPEVTSPTEPEETSPTE